MSVAKFSIGQKVVCNGNPEGIILRINQTLYEGCNYFSYNVRLWQGNRHVGDVVVSQHDLLIENKL